MRYFLFLIIFIFHTLFLFAQNNVDFEQIAISFANNKQMDSCAYYYGKAANQALQKNDLLQYCDLKGKEGKVYYDELEIEKSIALHQSIADNFEYILEKNNPLLLYQICSRLGADYGYSNKTRLAENYLNKAQKINEQYKLKETGIYLNLYQFYKDQDNLVKSFSTINTYQSLCEELKNWEGLANAKLCFGILHFKLSDYEKAINYHKSALQFYKEKNLEKEYCKPLMGIGNCYYKLGNFKEAISYYKQCYSYSNSAEKLGPCIVNIINSYVDMHELDSAKTYIHQYEKIRTKLKPYEVEKEFINALAGFYENKGDVKQAIYLLETNKKFYLDGNSNATLVSINERLAKLYFKSGQTKLAFKMLENAYQIQDTLTKQRFFVLDSLTRTFIEGQIKVERQEQNNKILEQQNLIQKRTNFSLVALSALLLFMLISVIVNNRLRIKKEKAEKESIQKTEDFNTFRYSVSHDLRNPLLSAQQNLNKIKTVLKRKNDKEAKNIIETTQQSLDDAGQFINRLRDFATADNQAIFKSNFDCKNLLEKILKEQQKQVDLKKISIKIEDLPTLHTDKILFSNILSNVISNAIKFSDTKKPTSSIAVFFEKNTNTLCISDNGKGIDTAILPDLFQPFVRQYREKEGAGLGLAIVKRLATQLDIDVSIERNDSEGATVKLLLKKIHLA